MSQSHGLKNIEWIIPNGVYAMATVFGKNILLEHGDLIKGRSEDDYEKHIHRRSRQLKKQIDYFRIGDKHQYTVYSKGRIVVNGCLNGTNSFADVLGFSGQAVQTLNYFIERDSGCAFYSSFPIDLEDIK
jgi:S-adenosylhomocysteine hydrolase